MASRAAAVLERMMVTAARLPDLACAEDVLTEIAQLVDDSIASDGLIRVQLDLAGPGTVVERGRHLQRDDELGADLGRWGRTHPSVLSYLDAGDDGSPRRVSDVVTWRRWQSVPAYTEVFRDRGGRHQLSLVTGLAGSTGTGWVLLRDGSDFSEHDVAVAALLMPQIVTLEAFSAKVPRGRCPVDLTSRERDVLRLLATGATASAIARQLGIAEGTVRKHLEHLYAKLGAHDRMTAVLNSRALAQPRA